MKKILIGCLALAALASCKKETAVKTNSYPTDGLTFEAKTRSLLMTGYQFGNPAMVSYDLFRTLAEAEYTTNLNQMSMLSGANSPLYFNLADTLLANFQSPAVPYYLLNGESTDITTFLDDIDIANLQKPILDVKYKVTSNDTAWLIDNKVKFFKDTITSGLFIATYMTGDVAAKKFPGSGYDLSMPSINKVIVNKDSVSYWDLELKSLDSTKVLIAKGDPVINKYLFIDAFNKKKIWGTQLGTYWPFGGQYVKGDVIGTRDTPIRHYFVKPKQTSFKSNLDIHFITVVWLYNPFTNSYEYVNSYTDDKSY